MTIRAMAGVVGVVLLVASAQAQTATPQSVVANDPVLETAAQEIGRALFLRCLCVAENFSFNAQGRMEEAAKTKPVDWTLAGIDVLKVERKSPEEVELDGVRVGVRWNDGAHEFQRGEMKDQHVRIVIAGDADGASAERTLHAVFSEGMDHAFEMSTPLYWRHYFFPSMSWSGDGLKDEAIVKAGTTGNGVAVEPPVQTKHVTTDYTLEASQVHLQGPVIMQVVVDEQGKPHRISIAQPLGYGLDAVAVAAAEKSTFAAPVVGGKPAVVSFYARANFSIHEVPSF